MNFTGVICDLFPKLHPSLQLKHKRPNMFRQECRYSFRATRLPSSRNRTSLGRIFKLAVKLALPSSDVRNSRQLQTVPSEKGTPVPRTRQGFGLKLLVTRGIKWTTPRTFR